MKVLFICVENTCRSQMAEGFARSLGIEAESAGLRAGAGVNEDAVLVMKERGIDISGASSKSLDSMPLSGFDSVISLCSANTADVCPATFVGTQENWNLEDPKGNSLEIYRKVRDQIEQRVSTLVSMRAV